MYKITTHKIHIQAGHYSDWRVVITNYIRFQYTTTACNRFMIQIYYEPVMPYVLKTDSRHMFYTDRSVLSTRQYFSISICIALHMLKSERTYLTLRAVNVSLIRPLGNNKYHKTKIFKQNLSQKLFCSYDLFPWNWRSEVLWTIMFIPIQNFQWFFITLALFIRNIQTKTRFDL